ncbi:Oligopeptide transporter OPT superfamily [Arabidopsis suecica]|uniref:Oligopeptide transporter OPT superfamily n=1 Tax=Arabidopsis suecica TaxID=45249 RepID=A0A8T2BN25_ARASU|nr:Oligopeptide transporter OPT superfamily [Arabidopsis suecica]
MTLFKNTFYFDFSPTFIGCGMICPLLVNCSVLLGAIISWGFLWPFISPHAGDWYPAGLEANDFKGLYGYKVFIAIALHHLPVFTDTLDKSKTSELMWEKKKRDDICLKDRIPLEFAVSFYVGLAAISTAIIPLIFPPLKCNTARTRYLRLRGLWTREHFEAWGCDPMQSCSI